VGDGHASRFEVAGLCGICNAFCHFCRLCCVDCLHPSGYGGTLSFPARAASALVRIRGGRPRKNKDNIRLYLGFYAGCF